MNDLTTEIKKLELETLDNLKLSKAKNTIRAYKSDYNDFVLFCSKHGMQSMPTNPKIISLYMFKFIFLNFCIKAFALYQDIGE